MNENSPIIELKGIGTKSEQLFNKLGIYNIFDLLYHYPRDYDIFEAPISLEYLEEDTTAAVRGILSSPIEAKRVRNLQIISTTIRESTHTLALTWFNMPFLRNTLKRGSCFIFRGKITKKNHRYVMEQPTIYTMAAYESLLHEMQPMYSLTAGLTNNAVTKAMKQALAGLGPLKEYLPNWILEKYELAEYNQAITTVHFPRQKDELIHSRKRLVFDEFFMFILAIQQLKENTEISRNEFNIKKTWDTEQLIESLPYQLTNAQRVVWREIEQDLTSNTVMSRLIQGDVGSGKTIVAILALVMVAKNNCQGALMVPTEVLAMQHYESMTQLFKEHQITLTPVLLTGSMTPKEKREVYAQIENGQADIIIGTHALIQEKVAYHNLALIITDEQHRFGVKQRETLFNKGFKPHILVMSATPIPRTLAIIVYGDLDISIIDELPAERLPIKNCVVDTSYRPKAYNFIQQQIQAGRQAYVICPMVEESETIEAENVIQYTQMLKESLPQTITAEYLHGSMKPTLKNEIMERFARNQIQILVSTTVIEVGINVPNASVIMIENAERFGLAQLHQLRGRVGRGKHQSYCILVTASRNKQIRRRLEILNKSNDGFHIANEDLKLRGPGDLFGLRQSGLLEFKIGDIFTDVSTLQNASQCVKELLTRDYYLESHEHQPIAARLQNYMNKGLTNISI